MQIPARELNHYPIPDPGQFAIGQMLVVVLALTVLGLAIAIRVIVLATGSAGPGTITHIVPRASTDRSECIAYGYGGCAAGPGILEQGNRVRREESS
jgi:hypothetical protein